MPRPKVTIIAMKLRGGRTMFEIWWLVKLLALFILVPLAVIGFGQILVCHKDHPKKPVLECLVHRVTGP
jgi:hypothetical protein